MIEAQPESDSLRSLEPQTVSAIHERYYAELFRYARFRTGDSQASEDMASEALVRLLEAVSAGKGPTTSLRGWLMGTLANLVNDHFRQMYGRPLEALSEDLKADGPDLHSIAESREEKRAVRRAMTRLTTEQQHVLTLRFGNGYSLEETARLMGLSTNAVKAVQFRAVTTLRKELGDRLA